MPKYLMAHSPEMRLLIKALGLPDGVSAFNLRARVDDVVTVTCKYRPTAESAAEIAKFLVCVKAPEKVELEEVTSLVDSAKRFRVVPKDTA